MKIVFIAHFAGSPEHGMVFGHYYLAREWVKMGHSVTIIAASYAHPRSHQPTVTDNISEEFIAGIQYIWVKTPPYSADSKAGRIRNINAFILRIIFSHLPLSDVDTVICSSHYPLAFIPAQMIARRYAAQLVFEVRDLWPLTLIELGNASPKHPFIRLLQWSEDYAYKHADAIVSVLSSAYPYMEKHGMSPEKFVFIPNGINIEQNMELGNLPYRLMHCLSQLRHEQKFIVGYAGHLNNGNDLDSLLLAMHRHNNRNTTLVVVGDGPRRQVLEEKVKQLDLAGSVLFMGELAKNQVNDFLTRTNALYVGYHKKAFYQLGVSPTKLNDYMLAAKPIIYAIDDPDNPVKESSSGVVCRAENIDDISNALDYLSSLTEEQRQTMGRQGYQWVLTNRNYKILAKRFIERVQEIIWKGGQYEKNIGYR